MFLTIFIITHYLPFVNSLFNYLCDILFLYYLPNSQKYKRGGLAGQIVEESIDVELMIEQLKTIFPMPITRKFVRNQKLERLEKLLNGELL